MPEAPGPFTPETRVLIYQYGKVASTSLQDSIGRLMQPPRHIRYSNKVQSAYGTSLKTHVGAVARSFLESMPGNATAWVVTATRSPFHQRVSAFFQTVEQRHGPRVRNMTAAELQELFRASCPAEPPRWFSKQFLPATGVDLLPAAAGVPRGKRVVHGDFPGAEGKRLAVLVLRFEDIKRWESQLRRTFPGFAMSKENSPVQKWYHKVYKQFLETYAPSDAEVRSNCESESLTFYTEEEVCALAPECCRLGAKRSSRLREGASDPGRGFVTTPSGEELTVYDALDGGYDGGDGSTEDEAAAVVDEGFAKEG